MQSFRNVQGTNRSTVVQPFNALQRTILQRSEQRPRNHNALVGMSDEEAAEQIKTIVKNQFLPALKSETKTRNEIFALWCKSKNSTSSIYMKAYDKYVLNKGMKITQFQNDWMQALTNFNERRGKSKVTQNKFIWWHYYHDKIEAQWKTISHKYHHLRVLNFDFWIEIIKESVGRGKNSGAKRFLPIEPDLDWNASIAEKMIKKANDKQKAKLEKKNGEKDDAKTTDEQKKEGSVETTKNDEKRGPIDPNQTDATEFWTQFVRKNAQQIDHSKTNQKANSNNQDVILDLTQHSVEETDSRLHPFREVDTKNSNSTNRNDASNSKDESNTPSKVSKEQTNADDSEISTNSKDETMTHNKKFKEQTRDGFPEEDEMEVLKMLQKIQEEDDEENASTTKTNDDLIIKQEFAQRLTRKTRTCIIRYKQRVNKLTQENATLKQQIMQLQKKSKKVTFSPKVKTKTPTKTWKRNKKRSLSPIKTKAQEPMKKKQKTS